MPEITQSAKNSFLVPEVTKSAKNSFLVPEATLLVRNSFVSKTKPSTKLNSPKTRLNYPSQVTGIPQNKIISKPTHKKKAHSMRISSDQMYLSNNGSQAHSTM